MKAALYVRVSTESQADEGFSISAQTHILSEYCKRNNIDVYKIYSDEGISGQKEDRPQFQQMIKDAERKQFDIILVHKFDRFARKIELSQRIKRQLRQSGVNVISITEPIEDSPIGFFTEGIMELLAEWYVKNLSAETKKGHLERARLGLHNGSVPYGYMIDNTIEAKMRPNKEQAKVVRYIFDCYVRLGYGISKIAKILNDSKIEGAVGGRWCPKRVNMILSNPKYAGMIKLGPNIFPGLHQPIIDKDIWETAQIMLKEHSKRYTYRGNNHADRYLLGICKCAECGKAVVIRNSGKHKYYVCSANRRHYEKICNNSMTYRVERLEEHIMNALKNIFEFDILDFEVIKRPNVYSFNEDRKKALKAKLERLKMGFLEGIFDSTEYKKIEKEIENELDEINKHEKSIDKQEIAKNAKTYYDKLKDCENAGEIRAILKQFIDHISVGKNDIRLYFYAN